MVDADSADCTQIGRYGQGQVTKEPWSLLANVGLWQCGREQVRRLVLSHSSIEDSLQHLGDRSSGEVTHSLVLERNVQPGYSCPCEAKLCRMPTGDHCHHCGGTPWGFVVSDPLLAIISSSANLSEERLSASEVAS